MPKAYGKTIATNGKLKFEKCHVLKNRMERGVMVQIGENRIFLDERQSLKLSNIIVDQVESWEPR